MQSVSVAISTALTLLLSAACTGSAGGPPERIIFIVVDTLRRDHVAVYGEGFRTPHIDSLAKDGQLFPSAYSSFSMTNQSMGAIFTGRSPSLESGEASSALPYTGRNWCGLRRFAKPGDRCVPASLPTLGEEMRRAGYWTIGVASNALLHDPAGFSRGMSDWTEVGRVTAARPKPAAIPAAERNGSAVNRAVFEALKRRESDRFFLYVHYMDAHDYRRSGRTYLEGVWSADEAVGGLLEVLRGAGMLRRAVVVFTSDHGERLDERHPLAGNRGHLGNPAFDYLLAVPLIVSPPIFEDASTLVRGEDLFDLLREIAGLEPLGKSDVRPGELFLSEVEFRTHREGQWKTMISRETDRLHLFDLEADPNEKVDLSRTNPERASAQRRRVDTLTAKLAAPDSAADALSADDLARLRALGYAD